LNVVDAVNNRRSFHLCVIKAIGRMIDEAGNEDFAEAYLIDRMAEAGTPSTMVQVLVGIRFMYQYSDVSPDSRPGIYDSEDSIA